MGKSRRSLSRPTTKIEEELKVVNESSLKLLIAEALKAQEEIHGDEIKALTAELLVEEKLRKKKWMYLSSMDDGRI